MKPGPSCSCCTQHPPPLPPLPPSFTLKVKEKKKWARLQKMKGDCALLAGSPRDAFEHYKNAMDLARASNDALW